MNRAGGLSSPRQASGDHTRGGKPGATVKHRERACEHVSDDVVADPPGGDIDQAHDRHRDQIQPAEPAESIGELPRTGLAAQ
jgi:hypothetical protein